MSETYEECLKQVEEAAKRIVDEIDAADDYRLSSATRKEWAERALKAEAELAKAKARIGNQRAQLDASNRLAEKHAEKIKGLKERLANPDWMKDRDTEQQINSNWKIQNQRARIKELEAERDRLREALTLIELLYYLEEKDNDWKAPRMNGVARDAQDGESLARYHRIFPRAALNTEGDT